MSEFDPTQTLPMMGNSRGNVNDHAKVTAHLIAEARRQARQPLRYFVSVLSDMLQRPVDEIASEIATLAGLPYWPMHRLADCIVATHIMPLDQLLSERLIIARDQDERLVLVISDPFHLDQLERMRVRLTQAWRPVFALESDIVAYLSKCEHEARALHRQEPAKLHEESKALALDLTYTQVVNESNPVVKFVSSTLYDALKTHASDIHLESTATGIHVKYRIDGVLDKLAHAPGIHFAEQVVSRIKVLAELDIAERRIPQDGSLAIKFDQRDIDLRISIMPSIYGEDVVIRILDKQAMMDSHGALRLDSLGFAGDSLEQFRQLSQLPYGMLLVTGPTGSGKTTSLYASLTEINTQREKIITIEDPVEYQLPGILQIPVNEKKGLSFAKGLRSILRHDPDIIMVGEIRDRETAEIAIQSALTGHLVFTTVHANSVYDVFGRFTHMGVDLYAFVSSLNGIVAQRLVRKNCPRCASAYTPSDSELQRAKLQRDAVRHFTFMQGTGCGECRGTGYKGRRAIAEILVLNDELREMIIERKSIRQIKEEAQRQGVLTLRQAALGLVERGETSLAEINKTVLHV